MRQIIISPAFAVGLVVSSAASAQTQPSAPAIAAQRPASTISTAPAPPGDTVRQALARNEISYANVWADDKGQTHVTQCVLKGLQLHSFAPPAAPYLMGIAPEDVESIVFSVLPAGWFGDWHHAPGPQWVITLSGQWEVQTTDGSTLRQGPGEFQFNSDEQAFATAPGGHVGHTGRLVGADPNVRMIITLKKRPGQSYANQSCVL
jgi:hypothetical protein